MPFAEIRAGLDLGRVTVRSLIVAVTPIDSGGTRRSNKVLYSRHPVRRPGPRAGHTSRFSQHLVLPRSSIPC